MRVGYREAVIALFIAGILVGLCFGGGVIFGRNSAPVPTQVAAAGGAGGTAAAGGAGAAGGGAGGAGGGGGAAAQNLLAGQTVGTITGVEGDAITLRGLDGRTSTMAESLSTRVTNSVQGTVSDLRPGQLVAINPGPPDAQGRTIASAILILPPTLNVGAPAAGTPGAGGTPRATGTPGAGGASATPAR